MNAMTPFVLASLRFESVSNPWIWLVLIILGTGFLIWTYRSIYLRSERRLIGGLFLLRAAGLLTLVLALAKPTWTRENDLVDPGRVAVVVDNSVSMSIADPTGPTRFALAREAVERLRQSIEGERTGPRVAVDVFDIAGSPLGPNAKPDAERTDLVRGVNETVARLRSRPLAALVLVSDGNDNTGRPDLRELADTPVPVHTVGFANDPKAGGLDLAVRAVRAPTRAMVHNQIKVDVTVTKTGGPSTKADLTIRRGRESFASQKVTLPEGDTEQTVSLTFTPSQTGTFVFTAGLSGPAGERLLSNNAAHFPVRVDSEPIRILYVEGFLRYEYKFLKNRFEDDPDVSLVSIVRRVNPDRTEARSGDDLISPDRLKNFDVVVLGDMEGSYLNSAEYQALLKWLNEKNHAILVLGGYRSFGPAGFRTTPLAEALPVVFASGPPYQSEEPFSMEVTDEGRRHPIFEVSGDRTRDAATWAAAPQLSGTSLVASAKPGAEILAVDPGVKVGGKPAVVVAVQRFGEGHTMALAADTTWRWTRFTRVLGRSDTLYARFWSQTVRWLSGRSVDDQRPPLVVSTDRPDYDVGKAVTVRAVRQPRAGQDLGAAEVAVEVTGPSGRSTPLPLRASSAEPDAFTGTFYPAAGGRYEIAATLNGGGKAIANQATEFLVHGSDLELSDPGTNRAALRSLATSTGGQYVDVKDASSLSALIPRRERRTRRVERSELWNSPFLFYGFLGFVTAEWLLRRRNQLV